MPPKKRRKIQDKSLKRKLFRGNRSTSFHSDDSIKAAEELRAIFEEANVIPSGEYALNPTLKIREEDVYFTPIRTVTLGGRRKTKRKKHRRKRKRKTKRKRKRKRKTKRRRR